MGDVIQFGQARLRRDYKGHCPHLHCTYDTTNRIIECEDCGRQLDAFDAFMLLVDQHESAWAKIRAAQQQQKADENRRLLQATVRVDRAWRSRSMVPTCPHCDEAIFPDDRFGASQVSKKLAMERRAFKARARGAESTRKPPGRT